MRRLTTAEFVERAQQVHGDRFDYTESVYTTKRASIQIKCRTCTTQFITRASRHLYEATGCPTCAGNRRKSTSVFVDEARRMHSDLYDYSRSVYETRHSLVEIGCTVCGDNFVQEACVHLAGSGCPRCAKADRVRESFKESRWLDALNVPRSARQAYIRSLRVNVDALVDKRVYEFYGSFFHGDPRCYAPDTFNQITKCTMGELYAKTLVREESLKSLGLEVVFIWERDFENGLLSSPRHPHECSENTAEVNRGPELVAL